MSDQEWIELNQKENQKIEIPNNNQLENSKLINLLLVIIGIILLCIFLVVGTINSSRQSKTAMEPIKMGDTIGPK